MDLRRRFFNAFPFFAAVLAGWITVEFALFVPYLQIAIVILYAFIIVIMHHDDPTTLGRYADSIYFVGFMFTLLGILKLLTGLNPGEDIVFTIQIFVRNMGVALWTPVVGILARIAVKDLFGHDVDEDGFKPKSYTEGLEHAYNQFMQSHNLMRLSIDKFLEARNKDIEFTKKSRDDYEGLTKAFSDKSSAILVELKNLANELKNLNSEMAHDGKHLIEDFRSASEATKSYAVNLNKTRDNLSSVVESAKNLSNQLADINSKMKANQDLSSFLDETLQKFMDLINKKFLELSQVESEALRNNIDQVFKQLQTELILTVRFIQKNLAELRDPNEVWKR